MSHICVGVGSGLISSATGQMSTSLVFVHVKHTSRSSVYVHFKHGKKK